MSLRGQYVDVDEAARLSGVTKRHVARLGEQGQIRYLMRGLIDRGSVEEYLSEREFSRARPWDEATAWAAVALLAQIEVDWLGQVQLSRLRGRLRHLASDDDDGSQELVGRARRRASVRTYESHDFLVSAVRERAVVAGRRGLGLAGTDKNGSDGYVANDVLAALETSLGLVRDSGGKIVLRATGFDLDVIRDIATTGDALGVLDAASSMDPRERGVGTRALTKHLQDFARG